MGWVASCMLWEATCQHTGAANEMMMVMMVMMVVMVMVMMAYN